MTAWLCGFGRNRKGAALVEFAIALPVLVLLFVATYEITGIIRAYLKLANAARTLAELVAGTTKLDGNGKPTVKNPDVTNFCNGAKLVMAPLPGSGLAAAIYSVTKSSSGVNKVDNNWPDITNCGAGPTIADATTIAGGVLVNNGDSVIIVNATYSYTSSVKYLLPKTITLTQLAFARPRKNTPIKH